MSQEVTQRRTQESNSVNTQGNYWQTGRGTKRLVSVNIGSVNICSVEGNSAGIFDSKVSPEIFVVKEK